MFQVKDWRGSDFEVGLDLDGALYIEGACGDGQDKCLIFERDQARSLAEGILRLLERAGEASPMDTLELSRALWRISPASSGLHVESVVHLGGGNYKVMSRQGAYTTIGRSR